MTKPWNDLEKMLVLSVSFTITLLAVRMLVAEQWMYIFLAWNLFLAIVPMLISRTLCKYNSINGKVICLLFCWLMFLPNAPYIITDFFHLTLRPPVPLWVDLMLLTSAAWNGLLLGIISLLQVESFLSRFMRRSKVSMMINLSLGLCAFGIYLGRFLRFNSWDVVANPDDLYYSLRYRMLYPWENLRTWGFTLLFGCLLWVIYFTVKKLPAALAAGK